MSIVGGLNQNDTFIATLRLFSDKEELERRMALFNQSKEQAEKAIALVGPANEILALREKAASDASTMATALDEAHTKAEQLVAEGRARAAAIEAAAGELLKKQQQALEDAQRQATSLLAAAHAKVSAIEARERAALEKIAAAEAGIAKALRDSEAASKVKAEYEAKLAAVKEASAKYLAALG